jgi:hypothetical protein
MEIVNPHQVLAILKLVHQYKVNEIPKEYLTEEIFTQKVNPEKDTLLHRCAQFSFDQSFSKLPENLKQEKYLLLKNGFGETVLHNIIRFNHADEVSEEVIFKNLTVTDNDKNTLLHKLVRTYYKIPEYFFKTNALNLKNIKGETPIHILTISGTSKIPEFVAREQMISQNTRDDSPLDLIIQNRTIKELKKEILARLKFEDLQKSNEKDRYPYSTERLKELHIEAVKYTIEKQLTKKLTK